MFLKTRSKRWTKTQRVDTKQAVHMVIELLFTTSQEYVNLRRKFKAQKIRRRSRSRRGVFNTAIVVHIRYFFMLSFSIYYNRKKYSKLKRQLTFSLCQDFKLNYVHNVFSRSCDKTFKIKVQFPVGVEIIFTSFRCNKDI